MHVHVHVHVLVHVHVHVLVLQRQHLISAAVQKNCTEPDLSARRNPPELAHFMFALCCPDLFANTYFEHFRNQRQTKCSPE